MLTNPPVTYNTISGLLRDYEPSDSLRFKLYLGARAGRRARGGGGGGGGGAGGELDDLVIAEQGDGTGQPGGVATLQWTVHF